MRMRIHAGGMFMFCMKCGQNLPDDAVFCSKCGNKVGHGATSSNDRIIHLKCSSCGGSMSVDADRPVLTCPYCGASDLINESDNVTIQRIQSKAYRDVQLGEQRSHKEVEIAKTTTELEKKKLEAKTERASSIVFFVLAFFMMLFVFFIAPNGDKIMDLLESIFK